MIQMFILLQRGLTLEERYRDPRERDRGERGGRLLVCGVCGTAAKRTSPKAGINSVKIVTTCCHNLTIDYNTRQTTTPPPNT